MEIKSVQWENIKVLMTSGEAYSNHEAIRLISFIFQKSARSRGSYMALLYKTLV